MKSLFAVAALVVLAGCAANNQCVEPDPVQPSNANCWNKGVDCGSGIKPNIEQR